MPPERLGASFRDRAGFVFRDAGVLYRHVNPEYRPHYERLKDSGLLRELNDRRWLVSHEEQTGGPAAYRILRPVPIPYVSYPYEWCFSQLLDAAVLTLDIQQLSLTHGMVLRDASAYNVQFQGCRPVLIDTLSFAIYEEGQPWVAYRQFCQHFLGPLAIMAYRDVRLRRLLSAFIDGVPVSLASRLMPWWTRLRPGLAVHLHLHARGQRRYQAPLSDTSSSHSPRVERRLLVALTDGLRRTVLSCRRPSQRTEWGDYYGDTNYSAEAMAAKEALVSTFVDEIAEPGQPIHDLGANTGKFSRLLARSGRYVVAHDVDELAVDRHYRDNRTHGIENVLPLLLDLTSPSPALGWDLDERSSALERLEGGVVVALAIIHHLAISNNVPLDRLARFFARITASLVIEFVPKEDSQVRRLLATREDVFPDYTIGGFEKAFGGSFRIHRAETVPGTERRLYALRRTVVDRSHSA